MKRATAILGILFVAAVVPALFVAVRCGGPEGRTHESCLKDAILSVQRTTRRAAETDDFDSMQKVEQTLREEGRRLRELSAEFAALPPPSRWGRSRLKKHRAIAETALDDWTSAEIDFRSRVEGGVVPPHVRIALIDALDEFSASRREAWATLIPVD